MDTISKVGKARLQLLIRKLEKLQPRRFNYAHWVDRFTWQRKPDLSCGTTACAMGWATTIPSLRKLGLRLNDAGNVVLAYRNSAAVPSCDTRARAYGGQFAAAKIFTIDESIASLLFLPDARNFVAGEEIVAPAWYATPKQVAKHIRRVLAKLTVLR